MDHEWKTMENFQLVQYKWKKNEKWYSIKLEADLNSKRITTGSLVEFITENCSTLKITGKSVSLFKEGN